MTTTRKQVTTYVDRPTHEWLVGQAREQHRTLSQFVSMHLRAWASEHGAKEIEEDSCREST